MESEAIEEMKRLLLQKKGKKVPRRYVTIHIHQTHEQLENSIARIEKTTEYIHINGHPYLWIVQHVLDRLPNLKCLRVVPRMRRLVGPRHMTLLNERKVKLEIGHHSLRHAWEKGELRDKKGYEKKMLQFRSLTHSQKKFFRELLKMKGIDDARVVSRYLCLRGEAYIPLREIGRKFGYSDSCAVSVVSFKISAVFKCLDNIAGVPSEVPPNVAKHAAVLQKRVDTARYIKRKEKKERKLIKTFGTIGVPEGCPRSKLAAYLLLHRMYSTGKVHELLLEFGRGLKILELRYGLSGGTYRSCVSVGKEFGLCGESVRQAEAKALKILGIKAV